MKLLTIQSLVCFVRERVSWGDTQKEILVEATVEGDEPYESSTQVIKLIPQAVQDLIKELGTPNPADLKAALQDAEYWKNEYNRLRDVKNEKYNKLLRAVESKEPGISIEILLDSGEKIQAIKQVREVTNIGLKEAKDIIDNWCTRVNWGVVDSRAYQPTYASGNCEWPPNTSGKEVFKHLLEKQELLFGKANDPGDPFKDE